MIIVFRKLNEKVATDLYQKVTAFFENNPDRDLCRTDLFDIRRSCVVDDILERCEDGVKLPGGWGRF